MPQTMNVAPKADEYAPYYGRYIQLISGDPVAAMRAQLPDTLRLFSGLSETDALARYAPGKWSVKQVIGHLCDCERIMSYRALRFARKDVTPLLAFEENDYAENGGFDQRPLGQLTDELRAIRAASIALFEGLDAEAFERRGIANNQPVSVRALAYIIPGHELHHRKILREQYGLTG